MRTDTMQDAPVTQREGLPVRSTDTVPPKAESGHAGRSVTRGRRLTFREAINAAEEQVGFAEMFWGARDAILARNLCRVMAEVYMMPANADIRIDGDFFQADMVADVFAQLTCSHIEGVIGKLRDKIGTIRCPKAYMRAMLYNSVMEFEYGMIAEVRSCGSACGPTTNRTPV